MSKSVTKYLTILIVTILSHHVASAQKTYDNQKILISLDSVNFPSVNLGEVVIKSSREKRPLRKLPISTSLVPTQQIEQEQVTGITDLTTRIPNLYMPSYGSKLTSPIYIRGIGSRINDPAVGLYVDYVPHFDKSSFDFEFYDIERVEILRGPQGTLYGRNNMGGLIHVFTQSPENAEGIEGTIELGNYGLQTFNFKVNQPVREKTDIQLSGQYRHRDGFLKNEYSGKMADQTDAYNGRFRLVQRWTDNFHSDLIVSYENSDQSGYPYAIINDHENLQEVNYNEPSGYQQDLFTSGLVNSWNRGNLSLRSVTSAQYIDDAQMIDQDFTPTSQFFVTQQRIKTILSQEFTATIEKEDLETVIGAFAFSNQLDKDVRIELGEDKTRIGYKTYDQSTRGIAAFTQTTISNFITRNLSFTSGLRVDWENSDQDYYYEMRRDGNVTPVSESDSELKFSQALPRLTFDYQLYPQVNIYGSLTKGYKTGGFNSTFERPEDQTFEAEQSWNYEAGMKTGWLFNLLRLSFSGFYIDWKNQQIYQPVPGGSGSMLTNAGRSVSRGLESELIIRPNKTFETTINLGHTRATFEEYQKNDSVNLAGNFLPYAPKLTLYVGQYIDIPINSKILDKAGVNINYRGTGKLYWNEENSASQDYYGILNASATLSRKNIYFTIWAKNITDTDYHVFRFSALGNNYAQSGVPAIWGVRIRVLLQQ